MTADRRARPGCVSGRGVALALAAVLASMTGTRAQEPARTLLDRGLALRGPAALAEALGLFEQAARAAAAAGDRATEGRAWRAIGGARTALGDVSGGDRAWTQATEIFTALDDWTAVGAVASERGLAAFRHRAFDDAERWWLSALGTFQRAANLTEQSRMLRNLTFLPRLAAADRMALASQAIETAVASGDATLEGESRHQFSDLLVLAGDLGAASAELDVAVPLLERAAPAAVTARALTSLGRLRRLFGRPQDSIALNTRAAAMLDTSGDLDGAAQALDAVARAAFDAGDLVSATTAARSALAMARRSRTSGMLVLTLTRLAVLLAAANETGEAHRLLDEAEPLAPGGRARDNLVHARAELAQAEHRYDEGLAWLEQRAWPALALEDQIGHWQEKAEILRALGRTDDARSAVERAIALFDRESSALAPDDASKRGYFDRTTSLVENHVRLLLESGDGPRALEATERGRARAFVDLLASRRLEEGPRGDGQAAVPRPAAPAPAALSLAALLRRGGREGAAPLVEPAIASAASTPAPTLSEITKVPGALGSSLLVYWVGPDGVAAWVVGSDGSITMRRTPVPRSELQRLATDLSGAAGDAPSRGAAQAAADVRARASVDGRARRASRRLYDLLVAPIRASLPSTRGGLLTVVPHGPLFRVSFAGLRAPSGRYLIEDYRLHYVPSIAALRPTRPAADRNDEVVVVADPAGGATDAEGRPLPRLPGARAEARAIARLLAPAAVTVLAGADATESHVRAALPHAGVVHFATHGIVSDSRPWTSYLALTPEPGTAAADGLLTAGELYDLRLHASLVVLGACRTAAGPVTGDGITGLARAFFAAGAPTVVASLWDLPDSVTAEMQPAFYRRWRSSRSAAEALRDAQLEMLARLRAGRITANTPAGRFAVPEDPTLWAGLIVLGAP